jgi:DNA-binding response OmpR family regulator
VGFLGLTQTMKRSQKEWKLIELFLDNKNRVISYDEIIESIYSKEVSYTAIQTAISRIKNKTDLDIENIPKEGYILKI